MSTAPDKFAPFAISTHTYKTVDGHPILLDVMIPKKLVEAGPGSAEWKVKRPILLNFHPGWLIGGQRDFQPWWSQWLIDLIIKNGAIAVSPDHRLIPEATCEDVLDDIHDSWEWVVGNLGKVVESAHRGLQPDLSRILLAGGSAGGYCAFQIGLTYHKSSKEVTSPDEPKPRAVIAIYPYISIRTPHWTQAYEKNIFGIPQLPVSMVDDHLASIAAEREKTGKQPVLTSVPMLKPSGEFADRALFATCAEQHGRILELFGPERDTTPGKRRMHPEDRIIDGRVLPPTIIVQGSDDSISPVGGADLFVEHLRNYKAIDGWAEGKDEKEVLRYYRVPGEHLFDTELTLHGETQDWVKDAGSFIEKSWL
ncbi:alpha/beta-hydrolase [Fomitiporia mediterranea MF3/22]|uniref:alpha/beta-hydrolase n=1 Tax=Fomitiporia mediterranea (strain MF3/22) TaxID=694068 RepID=UPI00044093B9|nr:alpha/beta-hydrolase [Fomitiporia mediterranea MF3/22]EJC99680.1 alpha/beta-hydrolase [Fomitiporia mediterranea MF3/22]